MISTSYQYAQSSNNGEVIGKCVLCFRRELTKKELSFLDEAQCFYVEFNKN